MNNWELLAVVFILASLGAYGYASYNWGYKHGKVDTASQLHRQYRGARGFDRSIPRTSAEKSVRIHRAEISDQGENYDR